MTLNRWTGLSGGILLGILWFLCNAAAGSPDRICLGLLMLAMLGLIGFLLGYYYRQAKIQAQAAESRARELDKLLSHATEAILVVDSQYRVVRATRHCLELFGVKEEDVVGRNLGELSLGFTIRRADGTIVPLSDTPVARALRGEEVHHELIRVERGDRTFDLLTSASPLVDEATGKVVLAACSSRNATEFRQLDRLKDEFITTASHELRTPITLVRALAQLTLLDLREERRRSSGRGVGEAIANQESIIAQADRVAELLNQMMNISHIDTGKLVLRTQMLQVPVLLAQEISELQFKYSTHALLLDLSLTALPWRSVRADPEKLTHVFALLIDNAVTYSPPGSTVNVEVKDVHGGLEVAIRDHGIGVPREEQELIFAKFYRAVNPINADRSGLGLGLYISRKLIELHGGRIWLDSDSGPGATFRLFLPACSEALAQQAPVTSLNAG